MSEHLEGRPVSTTTYKAHGCRCDGCRAEAAEYMRGMRSNRGGALIKVDSRYRSLVHAWASERMTDEDRERLRAQAYVDLGIERRPRGPQRQR